jgi:hypothetical protein
MYKMVGESMGHLWDQQTLATVATGTASEKMNVLNVPFSFHCSYLSDLFSPLYGKSDTRMAVTHLQTMSYNLSVQTFCL